MKLKKRNCFILVIIIIVLIIGGLSLFKRKEIVKIEEDAPTLKAFKESSYYQEKYQEAYKEITFRDNPKFLEITNQLLDKNYQAQEINQIFTYLSDRNIENLLTIDYVSLENYYEIKNLDVLKIKEYEEYQKENNVSLADAVTRVNIHLNEEFYTNIEEVDNPDSLTVLVNKFHSLPSDYEPTDLVNVGQYSYQMRKEAALGLEKLMAYGSTQNVYLIPFSTYRSYDYQEGLYDKYLTIDPLDVVDTYSARAGHSEHQTGLAVDLRSSVLNDNVTDEDYEWLLNNSYLYGFIVRYPKGKSDITGYMEEPWHLRYIGVEHATKVHELDITYDEYYDLYLEKH